MIAILPPERFVERRVSAKILSLSDYRVDDATDDQIDLVTAVEVAIRDLREILSCWGTESARERALECESTLRCALNSLAIE
jgi:hypothetical protein